jgi:hypothetical protein
MDSSEVITFRTNLKQELGKVDEKQQAIIKPLLQFVGFLPIPIDKPEPPPPHQSFVANVINTMRQKVKKSSWTDEMTKTVTNAVNRAKDAVKAKTAEMASKAASEAANTVPSAVPSVVPNEAKSAEKKSFFSKVTNAVEGRFKPSAIEQAKEDLELKELQLRIKKINRELAAMNAESVVPSAVPSTVAESTVAESTVAESAAPSAVAESAVPSAVGESAAPSAVESKAESAAPIAAAESAAAPMPASLPPTSAKLYSPQGSSQLPRVIGQGGGRRTRRTRRIRASTRSLRQRARE